MPDYENFQVFAYKIHQIKSSYLENELENPFTYQQANINLKTTF